MYAKRLICSFVNSYFGNAILYLIFLWILTIHVLYSDDLLKLSTKNECWLIQVCFLLIILWNDITLNFLAFSWSEQLSYVQVNLLKSKWYFTVWSRGRSCGRRIRYGHTKVRLPADKQILLTHFDLLRNLPYQLETILLWICPQV